MSQHEKIDGSDILNAAEEVFDARKERDADRREADHYRWSYYGHDAREKVEKAEQLFEEKLRLFILQEVRAILAGLDTSKN